MLSCFVRWHHQKESSVASPKPVTQHSHYYGPGPDDREWEGGNAAGRVHDLPKPVHF